MGDYIREYVSFGLVGVQRQLRDIIPMLRLIREYGTNLTSVEALITAVEGLLDAKGITK